MGNDNRRCWGLVRSRQVWVPTWKGGLLLLAGLLICGRLLVPRIHDFLAMNKPSQASILVVEGWMTDSCLEDVVKEFHAQAYSQVLVTGGPIEFGAPLSEYKTMAQRGAETLLRMGLSTNQVQAVPSAHVRQDRTYTSALALQAWFRAHGQPPARITLVSQGPHARRSRLLFQMALGKGTTVGVIALPATDYDEATWWRTSSGVRDVIGELLAYFYARVLFRPA